MHIIIHRGTREIGGSCVEVRAGRTRILIDFGMPLVNDRREPFDPKVIEGKTVAELIASKILPDIAGLYGGAEARPDAILLSHAHLDHYGLLRYVDCSIPVMMSEGAKQLVEVSDIFLPLKVGPIRIESFGKRKRLAIGDFTVTPYLVDHSGFDARAFLIEAGGKRLIYSGDFRAHGRKGVVFERFVEHPPENIDCCLMEGSMLGRSNDEFVNEDSVRAGIERALRASSGISFLFASSQNIDRIVSAYKACVRTGTVFVIDLYTAFVLDKLRKVSENIPQFNWRNVRVIFFDYYREILANAGYRGLLYFYGKNKIAFPELTKMRGKVLMLARDNSLFRVALKELGSVRGGAAVYSMWRGYFTEELKARCERAGLALSFVHTSGHATVEDLCRFAAAVKPKRLIPIHTFAADEYKKHFANVTVVSDGEVVEI